MVGRFALYLHFIFAISEPFKIENICIMRARKLPKKVALQLAALEFCVITPPPAVESYIWNHEDLWHRTDIVGRKVAQIVFTVCHSYSAGCQMTLLSQDDLFYFSYSEDAHSSPKTLEKYYSY